MDAKPFQLSKLGSNPNDWIEATVDIAVNILKHRLKTLDLYNDEGKKVNDLATLLGKMSVKKSRSTAKNLSKLFKTMSVKKTKRSRRKKY